MVRIAPVRLTFNPKTLWFDAGDLDLKVGDDVVVSTARGNEFGVMASSVFDMEADDAKKLKSPLKPVKRLATDEDRDRNDELARMAADALPLFKQMAAETVPDMNPVSVEYLFDGDKAVFYFEAEERVDFRDLVRKLASEFRVRIDMKQIGVRDATRMIGGYGHCGQELCCRRLGGEFNPVSIRMAKEQDLSLNPAKISGVCGRLLCCLRYEYDAYKDFHGRAPKKNAKIETPDGEGKVVDLDVPREIVSIKVGDEKPVKVPLADMEPAEEGTRPKAVGVEAWERANEPAMFAMDSSFGLYSAQLTGEDQLAQPGKVRHVNEEKDQKSSRSRSRRRSGSGDGSVEAAKPENSTARKSRRRRSTTVTAEGEARTQKQPARQNAERKQPRSSQKQAEPEAKSTRRRSRRSSGAKAQESKANSDQRKNVQVGRNSSALRNARNAKEAQGAASEDKSPSKASNAPKAGQQSRRRRRSHKANTDEQK